LIPFNLVNPVSGKKVTILCKNRVEPSTLSPNLFYCILVNKVCPKNIDLDLKWFKRNLPEKVNVV
jgi:hypothetical protein